MTARTALLNQISEKDWLGFVTSLASIKGWASYHTFDSRNSPAGFPDCVFLKDGRVVFAELKSESGRLTPAQQWWLDELGKVAEASNGAVSVHLWRPSQRDDVEKVLA